MMDFQYGWLLNLICYLPLAGALLMMAFVNKENSTALKTWATVVAGIDFGLPAFDMSDLNALDGDLLGGASGVEGPRERRRVEALQVVAEARDTVSSLTCLPSAPTFFSTACSVNGESPRRSVCIPISVFSSQTAPQPSSCTTA